MHCANCCGAEKAPNIQTFRIWLNLIINNYAIRTCWIQEWSKPTRRHALRWLITVSDPTRAYGIVINYSPKWRWIIEIQIPKNKSISFNIPKNNRKWNSWRAILPHRLTGGEYYLLFTSKLANQRARGKINSLVWSIIIVKFSVHCLKCTSGIYLYGMLLTYCHWVCFLFFSA